MLLVNFAQRPYLIGQLRLRFHYYLSNAYSFICNIMIHYYVLADFAASIQRRWLGVGWGCAPPTTYVLSIVSKKARNSIYEKTGFFRFSGEPVTGSGFFLA